MYSIGQLSAHTGESVKTLRYWTDRGLLQARRGENRYRFYDSNAGARVAFIRWAQGLGFRLEAIAGLLALENRGLGPCQIVEQEVFAQLTWVRNQINRLQAIEATLMSSTLQTWQCSDLGYCQFLPTPEGLTLLHRGDLKL